MTKLALGTAQFGMDYGINNPHGQVHEDEVKRIVEFAANHLIMMLDTAASYGNSEEVVGRALHDMRAPFMAVSKLPRGAEQVLPYLKRSLHFLHMPRLYGYLFHDFDTWRRRPELWQEMQRLKRCGMVEKVGFSVYYPEQLEELALAGVTPDLVQLPYNLFDRRFETWIDRLAQQGTEVHVRSIFLQGLFFMSPDELPVHLAGAKEALQKLQQICFERAFPIAMMALAFVCRKTSIERAVIGTLSVQELGENLRYPDWVAEIRQLEEQLKGLQIDDEQIIVPSNWS